jgi:hypothetical protein
VLLKFSLLKITTCVGWYVVQCGEQFRDLPLRVCGVQSAGKSGDQLSVGSRRAGVKSGERCAWQCVWFGE